MIRHWIKARFAACDRANSPAGKEIRPQETSGHSRRAIEGCNSSKQNLAGIRSTDTAWFLIAIECQRIGLDIRTPERGLEPLGQPRRLGIEPFGDGVAAKPARAARRHSFRGVDIALHFNKCDGALGKPPIGVKDRIVRILPTLISQTLIAGALIFDEAVAVRIAWTVDPAKRRFDRGPKFGDGVAIASAFGIESGEQDE